MYYVYALNARWKRKGKLDGWVCSFYAVHCPPTKVLGLLTSRMDARMFFFLHKKIMHNRFSMYKERESEREREREREKSNMMMMLIMSRIWYSPKICFIRQIDWSRSQPKETLYTRNQLIFRSSMQPFHDYVTIQSLFWEKQICDHTMIVLINKYIKRIELGSKIWFNEK